MKQQKKPENSGKLVVETKTTNYSDLTGKQSIEEIAVNGGKATKPEEKPKAFLTKKKLILFFVFLLISIGFVVITVRPILKVNWNDFNTSVGIGIARNIGWLWLVLILLQIFINLNRNFFTMIPRLKKWGYKISYKECTLFSLTFTFIAAVSPSNLISDPYTMFWLRTQGVPTSKVVSMFFTNTLMWQIAQIIVTMPFFIVCCVRRNLLTTSPLDSWLFAMICIGVIIDFIGLIFIFLLNWSKQFHYLCSRVFNWFKKKLHMKYHTKEEIIVKYKEKAVLKQTFYDSMKDWKTTLYVLAFWVLGDVLGSFSIVYCLAFVQNVLVTVGEQTQIIHVGFNIGWAFVCARLSVPANRLNILPGQAMGYEAALVRLLNVYGGWQINSSSGTLPQETIDYVQNTVVKNSVLTGKIFFSWLPAIAGIGGFVVMTKQQIKLSNEGKLLR